MVAALRPLVERNDFRVVKGETPFERRLEEFVHVVGYGMPV